MLGISRPHIKATVFSKVVKKSASARTICPGNGDLHITDRRWEVCHSFFWPHYLEIVQLVWRTLLFVNSSIFGGKIHWHGTNAPNRSPASSSLPPDFCKVSTQLDSSSRVARQNFGKKREVLWSLDTLLTKPFRRTESRHLFGTSNLQNQFWHNLFKKDRPLHSFSCIVQIGEGLVKLRYHVLSKMCLSMTKLGKTLLLHERLFHLIAKHQWTQ